MIPRREDVESAEDSRPSDRRPPTAYWGVRRGGRKRAERARSEAQASGVRAPAKPEKIALGGVIGGCVLALASVWAQGGPVNDPTENQLKAIAGLLALALLLLGGLSSRRDARRRAVTSYGLAAIVGIAGFYNFGAFRHYNDTRFINHWEHFHYQLGAKYFPELGYDGLYVASIAAQASSVPEAPVQPVIRDLRTNELATEPSIRTHLKEVAERFGAKRWNRFVADHDYYLRVNDPGIIAGVRRDHGYNPSPTWTFVARLFAARLPSSRASLAFLASLDIALLAVMFAAIFRTYGARACALALAVFGLGYGWRYIYMGAFLRLDWLAATTIGICALERKRPALAGALFGYATMVRVFPLLLLFGPAVLGAKACLRGEWPRWAFHLAAGFATAVILGLLAGSATGRGFEAWGEFRQNIQLHGSTWGSNVVGLESVVLNGPRLLRVVVSDRSMPRSWRLPHHEAERLKQERRGASVLLKAAFLALLIGALWQASLAEAAVLGIVGVFVLTPLSSYYWIMLLALPLGRGGVVALGFLALSTALYAFDLLEPPMGLVYAVTSLGLALLLLGWLLSEASRTLRSSP
jgi:hypothetical protein